MALGGPGVLKGLAHPSRPGGEVRLLPRPLADALPPLVLGPLRRGLQTHLGAGDLLDELLGSLAARTQ